MFIGGFYDQNSDGIRFEPNGQIQNQRGNVIRELP
jgi:hypothetical protein